MLTTLWVPKGESNCPPLRVRVVGKEGVKLSLVSFKDEQAFAR